MVQYFCRVDTHTPDPKYSYTVSFLTDPSLLRTTAQWRYGVNNRHMPMFMYTQERYTRPYVGESIDDDQVQSVCTSSIT